VAQVVEWLPSKHEALSSNRSPGKKKEKEIIPNTIITEKESCGTLLGKQKVCSSQKEDDGRGEFCPPRISTPQVPSEEALFIEEQ
jgi:hypothetical protein